MPISDAGSIRFSGPVGGVAESATEARCGGVDAGAAAGASRPASTACGFSATTAESAIVSARWERIRWTTSVSDSQTTYFLPSIIVMTVSGVQSARSIRSEFRANSEPERRVSVIIWVHHPCAFKEPSVVPSQSSIGSARGDLRGMVGRSAQVGRSGASPGEEGALAPVRNLRPASVSRRAWRPSSTSGRACGTSSTSGRASALLNQRQGLRSSSTSGRAWRSSSTSGRASAFLNQRRVGPAAPSTSDQRADAADPGEESAAPEVRRGSALDVDEVLEHLVQVVITRRAAWNPRWARIRLVNSAARSTFDISTAPAWSSPRRPSPATPSSGRRSWRTRGSGVADLVQAHRVVEVGDGQLHEVALHAVGEDAADHAGAPMVYDFSSTPAGTGGVRPAASRVMSVRARRWGAGRRRGRSPARGCRSGSTRKLGVVEVEGAGAGVEVLCTALDDEEAVALDHQVGGTAGGLRRALVEVGVRRGHLHAEADLDRVGAAALGGRAPRRR